MAHAEIKVVAGTLLRDARQARLQRTLALIAGLTSGASGLEVAYMHYRGSYSWRIMWTPIVMSQVLLAAGVAGAMKPRLARTLLPAVSAVTLADCATGFVFHLRGIARKPGGWRLLVPNVPMGPPPLAPLLFGVSAYLGILASRMTAESSERRDPPGLREKLRRHVTVVTAFAALCSGTEALYSHYKNGFHFLAQYTPLVVAPALAASALAALPRGGGHGKRKVLAGLSAAAMLDGAVGMAYHARGVLRRPGGRKHLMYNIMYGPPILAPLLFAACGLLGLLASAIQGRQ
ncbi:MAG TPA: hypothetical protein VIE13_12940 [Terriglobales bacterium]